MKRWWLIPLLLAAGPAHAQSVQRVCVLPVGGAASAELRREAAEELVRALRGLPDLLAIDLEDVGRMLGPEAPARLASCQAPGCFAEVLAPLAVQQAIFGALEPLPGGRGRLDLSLIDTSTSAARVLVRISRDLPAPIEASMGVSLPALGAELFPGRAARGTGSLSLSVTPLGAEVVLDGRLIGLSPLDPLRIPPGAHKVRASARGHEAEERTFELRLGQVQVVEINLPKRRSPLPFILAGAGAVTAGAGVLFGLHANGLAADWEQACPPSRCASGFTRARYVDDEAALGRDRVFANVLLGTGALLAVSAIVYYFWDPGVDGATP